MSSLFDQLGDPRSRLVKDALTRRCEVCKAKPEQECSNTIVNGAPLEGRIVHLARTVD